MELHACTVPGAAQVETIESQEISSSMPCQGFRTLKERSNYLMVGRRAMSDAGLNIVCTAAKICQLEPWKRKTIPIQQRLVY